MAWPASEVTLLADISTRMVGGSSDISFIKKKKTDRGISGGVSIVKLFCLAKWENRWYLGRQPFRRWASVRLTVGSYVLRGKRLRTKFETVRAQTIGPIAILVEISSRNALFRPGMEVQKAGRWSGVAVRPPGQRAQPLLHEVRYNRRYLCAAHGPNSVHRRLFLRAASVECGERMKHTSMS